MIPLLMITLFRKMATPFGVYPWHRAAKHHAATAYSTWKLCDGLNSVEAIDVHTSCLVGRPLTCCCAHCTLSLWQPLYEEAKFGFTSGCCVRGLCFFRGAATTAAECTLYQSVEVTIKVYACSQDLRTQCAIFLTMNKSQTCIHIFQSLSELVCVYK